MGKLVLPGALNMGCKKTVTGIGSCTTQTRLVSGFTAINLQMNGNVYYKRGSSWGLQISAPPNILNKLETYVTGSTLIVNYKDGRIYDLDENIRIDITAPEVNSFTVNMSGNITCLSKIETSYLFLNSYGSGNIWMKQVETGIITAVSSMSGIISATSGSALTGNIRTNGSGKIDLSGILTRSVIAHISGPGNIQVRATENLRATIEGSGSIYFSGYPNVISHISGKGHLVHL